MKTCAVDGCDRQMNAKGLCHTHYERRRCGRPLGGPIPSTPEERFFSKVDKTDTCWLWTGSRHGGGRYGGVYWQGKVRLAHRVSYEIHKGPIPDGLVVDHVKAWGCTSTLCVNPAHLEAVTQAVNAQRGDVGTWDRKAAAA